MSGEDSVSAASLIQTTSRPTEQPMGAIESMIPKKSLKIVPKKFLTGYREPGSREVKPPFFPRRGSRSPKSGNSPISSPKDKDNDKDKIVYDRSLDDAFTQYEKMINQVIRSPPPTPIERSDRSPSPEDQADDKVKKGNDVSSLFEDDAKPDQIVDATDIDFSISGDFCSHEHVVKIKNVIECEDCGAELYEEISHEQEWRWFGDSDSRGTGDPSRCQWRKPQEKGIKKDLERLRFPEDVCTLADELYMQITNGECKRSELRKGIMFASVFEAYKMLKRPRTPDELQPRFSNLERKNMSQGINYFRLRCARDYFQYEDISAKHFIPIIMKMKQFNATQEHIDKVILLYDKIKEVCPIINRSNPQSASKALIYYYFRRKGCMISPERFGRIVNLSEVIIERLAREISRVLDTTDTVSLNDDTTNDENIGSKK